MALRWWALTLLAAGCNQRHPAEPSAGAAGGDSNLQAAGAGNGSGGTSAVTKPLESPSEELLYDLGTYPPVNVYHLHVDGETLYWAQKAGSLMRGPKAGQAQPELFARYEFVVEGGPIRSDATHVYYLDGHFVKRTPKTGGQPQPFDIGEGNDWGNFIVTGDYVYQAPPWCNPLRRINKETGETTLFEAKDVTTASGAAELTVVRQQVYCANVGAMGGRIYVLEVGASELTLVREGGYLWGLTAAGQSLVFSSGAATIDLMKFHRFDLTTKTDQFLATAPQVAAAALAYDERRNLVFVDYASNSGQVGFFHLDSLAFSALIPSGRFMRRAFETDDGYVYWAQQGVGLPEQIRRISKDALPVDGR